jgi:hypothetical protein
MSHFSMRHTADARPVLMVDLLVSDEEGWRLFSAPMWQLEQDARKAALDELTRISERLGLYD